MFLAGVVCCGDFRLERPGLLASVVVVLAFWGFLGCMLCRPMVMWCIFGAVLGHLKADDTTLMIFQLSFKALQMLNIIK